MFEPLKFYFICLSYFYRYCNSNLTGNILYFHWYVIETNYKKNDMTLFHKSCATFKMELCTVYTVKYCQMIYTCNGNFYTKLGGSAAGRESDSRA